MTAQTYASPQAFKQALEQRLKTASTSGVDFARRRQLTASSDRTANSRAFWPTTKILTSTARPDRSTLASINSS
jgi:hypothetical protein